MVADIALCLFVGVQPLGVFGFWVKGNEVSRCDSQGKVFADCYGLWHMVTLGKNYQLPLKSA